VAANHLSRGHRLKAQGDRDAALAAYDLAVAADPFSAEAYLARAELLEESMQLVDALAAYQRALDLKRRSLPACLGLGRCLMMTGRLTAAAEAYERALALDPDNIKADLGIGDVMREQGKLSRAAEVYRKLLKSDPENQAIRLALASVVPGKAPDAMAPEYVTELFDDFAARYDDRMIEGLKYRTPQEIRRAVGAVAGPEAHAWRIMDLGCGTGLCGSLFRDTAQWLAGVDLSPAMIEKAETRGIYDELRVADLVSVLELEKGGLDLALAADVFIYLGNLSGVFSACAAALRPGGYFAFAAEITNEAPFVLQTCLRYAHSRSYCESLAAAHGFTVEHYERIVARHEGGVPNPQHLFVLRRKGEAAAGTDDMT
jgi:predicted TPR repeat methyltransferase